MTAPEQDVAWDAVKAQSNLAKYGVSFAQVATVLTDPPALTVFDAAHSETEERWFTLGMSSDGKLLAVAHTYQSTGSTKYRCALFRRAKPRAASVNRTQTNHDR